MRVWPLSILLLTYQIFVHATPRITTVSGIPNCEQGNDEIKSLPGWEGDLPSRMYSGFIEVNATANGSLFYWFIESEDPNANESTPVLIWINGGPGASSLLGLFIENGPFRLVDSKTLTYHNATWSKYYHMLYIDNPIGTGFSFCNENDLVTNNQQMAQDFLTFLEIFFSDKHCFGQYLNNPLYITGESHAGRYIPFIGRWIQSNDTIGLKESLKGLAIGNGLYDPNIQFNSTVLYAYNIGIIDEYKKDILLKNISDAWNVINTQGANKESIEILDNASSDWIYNNDTGNVLIYNFYIRNTDYMNEQTQLLNEYLNDENTNISEAIHSHGIKFSCTNSKVSNALLFDMVKNNSAKLIPVLLEDYRIMYYNGQLDGSRCNNLGNQLCLQQLNYNGDWYYLKRKVWKVNNGGKSLTAGYVKQSVDKKLTYVVVSDSGHLVPHDQPDNSLHMIRNFVQGYSW